MDRRDIVPATEYRGSRQKGHVAAAASEKIIDLRESAGKAFKRIAYQ